MTIEAFEAPLERAYQQQNTHQALQILATLLQQQTTRRALECLFQVLEGCDAYELAARLSHYARYLFCDFEPAPALRLPPASTDSLRFFRRWLLPAQAPRVSVCMIVRNEEHGLLRALQSVSTLANEIILVDTGSQDRTLEIAQNFSAPVQIYHFPWSDDFAAARNFSIEQASGDWIFCFDGDEYLSSTSVSLLKGFLSWPPIGLNVFNLWQINQRGPNDDERQPIERLFPRTPLLRFFGRLHEQLVCTDLAQTPGNLLLQNTVIVNPLTPARCASQHKRQRIEILFKALSEPEQNTPYLRFHLGWHWLYVAAPPDLPRALQVLQACLAESLRYRGQGRPRWNWSPAPLNMTCLLITDALQQLNEHARLCATFESWPPITHFAETWFRYARSSRLCGQTARAKDIFQRLRRGEFRALTTAEGCESWRAGLELIRLALSAHQPTEALALWQQIAPEIPAHQQADVEQLHGNLLHLQTLLPPEHGSSD